MAAGVAQSHWTVKRPYPCELKDIAGFQEAIRAPHGAESLWVETVPVKEIFQGRTSWDGEVEVFDITGHPRAKRCYAWRY
jgi:hypothetical protein